MAISPLDEYLETIPDDDNRERMVDVLVWVGLTYPELELRIEWNQPMLGVFNCLCIRLLFERIDA